VLPSGVGTAEVEVASITEPMGLGIVFCVALGLGRSEMVVHIDRNMPSDDGGLKQRRGLAVETRSQVEFMAWVVYVCAASLTGQWKTSV